MSMKSNKASLQMPTANAQMSDHSGLDSVHIPPDNLFTLFLCGLENEQTQFVDVTREAYFL